MSKNEKTPLVGSTNEPSPKKFYFLNNAILDTTSKNPNDHAVDIGDIPSGENKSNSSFSWFSSFFGQPKSGYQVLSNSEPNTIGSKPRAVPVKVEPKAWLHMAVTLASISMAIVAFAEANEWSQMYGLLLLPVSIAFCVYALFTYMYRASLIRRKLSGPYEDRIGPVVLAVLLGATITINFFVKIYHMSTKTK